MDNKKLRPGASIEHTELPSADVGTDRDSKVPARKRMQQLNEMKPEVTERLGTRDDSKNGSKPNSPLKARRANSFSEPSPRVKVF